jgi:transcription antitermination factor NusG
MDWHVVAVEPSSEGLVSRRAEELEIEAYVPQGTRMVRVRRRRHVELSPRKYPALPGYAFVRGGRADQFRREWEQPDTVPHCLGLLGVDGPETVPDAVVADLKAREAGGEFDSGIKTGRYWAPRWCRAGKAVRITEGPFRDAVGRIWRVSARRTVAVWLMVLGRETLAEVALDSVARVR